MNHIFGEETLLVVFFTLFLYLIPLIIWGIFSDKAILKLVKIIILIPLFFLSLYFDYWGFAWLLGLYTEILIFILIEDRRKKLRAKAEMDRMVEEQRASSQNTKNKNDEISFFFASLTHKQLIAMVIEREEETAAQQAANAE